MSDEAIDPTLQSQNNSDDYIKMLQMREVAQEAFVKANSRDAARRAMRARPRTQRSWKPGDLVYVYRILRERRRVDGGGGRITRKAVWTGPGTVLSMEGAVVWINMMGELWRTAQEQVRDATQEERLGAEVVAESFQEMQERLKRNPHRPGYRDVTRDAAEEEHWEAEARAQAGLPEEVDEELEVADAGKDSVHHEGQERGQPRRRLEEDVQPELPPVPEDMEDEENAQSEESKSQPEPESEEAGNRARLEKEALEMNDVMDGIPSGGSSGPHRSERGARWRTHLAAPYFNEVFFGLEEEIQSESIEPGEDYWVYDPLRGVLQRHHVRERKARFKPTDVKQCPIPLRSILKERKSFMKFVDGTERVEEDQWSWLDDKRPTRNWWKGCTEFKVDQEQVAVNQTFTAAGKRRGDGEIYDHEIQGEKAEWNCADKEEWQKIVESGAVKVLSVTESRKVTKELEARGELGRILPTRMVRRYKPSEEVGVPASRKSRWCVRGDKDPDILELQRFAPTVATSSLQVAMQAAVNHDLEFKIGDLKSAFTQSMPLIRRRGKLYCRQCRGGHNDLEEGQLVEIVLGCYGLPDAPLHWRRTLRRYLIGTLGYKPSRMDPCMFLLHVQGLLKGIVLVEVDDLLLMGKDEHHERVKKLQERFKFGKLKDVDEKGVGFNGRRIRIEHGVVKIDMEKFVRERLSEMSIEKERKKHPGALLQVEETAAARSVCGALNWIGKEGRPDAAAAASLFSSKLKKMTIADVIDMNKAVRKIKDNPTLSLQIQKLEDMRWGVVTDASWANTTENRSQGGHVVITFNKELMSGMRAKTNILMWKSGKLPRVVGSTLAAETQSLARGVGELIWAKVVYLEIVDPTFELRDWQNQVREEGYLALAREDSAEQLKEALAVVDAKSLFDLISRDSHGGQDRRTAIDIQLIKEELRALHGSVRWVEHLDMLADSLTKRDGSTESLTKVLESGEYGIEAESSVLARRADSRAKKF